ncbi:MAG: DUF4176 domain-containing protein [Oscillospiraceae bacterium]|nr:DUF4176 domain-containing protein [Oscillospiraceae bacterium]
MYKNMLPIGSVVLLKGGTKRVMITGRILTKAGEDKIYDYAACYYPEGIGGLDGTFFFDKEAIARLYFVGFQDEEELKLRSNILDKLGELEVKDGEIVPVTAAE